MALIGHMGNLGYSLSLTQQGLIKIGRKKEE
jgi:hypothetical protein